MFAQVIYAILLVSGQFPVEAPRLNDSFSPARSFEEAELPSASLQAPAWSADSNQYSSQPPNFPATDPAMIQPVGNETPLSPVSSEKVDSAASLVRTVLNNQGDRPLDGQPVALAEVLTGISGGEQRLRSTQMYWRLARSAAIHRFCVEETDFLFGLAVPQAAHQQAVLTSQQASAKADEARARLDVLRSQYGLAAARPAQSGLSLPSDAPFVGVYETRFDSFQSRGLAQEPLARIHATLPVLRELLERQADAVYAADAALRELQRGYMAGQIPLSGVLDGFEQLRRQRREFLASVLEYNESIAEYALAVASPNLPVDRVVGMLIEVPDGQRSVLATRRDQGTIRRVTNEAPVDSLNDGWSDRSPRLPADGQ
jgi:hypothetical protein